MQPIAIRSAGGGDEDAALGGDRIRQAAAGQVGLPADVFLFVPLHREVLLAGGAETAGAAELGGVLGERDRREENGREEDDSHELPFRFRRTCLVVPWPRHTASVRSDPRIRKLIRGVESHGCVNGTAPPRASQSRTCIDHCCAHESVCSFCSTFTRISFRPAFNVPRPTCWSICMPWWYSSRP